MIRVNVAYAGYIFSPFWGLGDVPGIAKPEVLLHGDVPNKNEKLRCIFYTYIIPYVRAWDEVSLLQAKLAMQYVLTFEPENAERYFLMGLPPCDAPKPATLVFEWVWEALFPGESWHVDRGQEYEVVHRPEEKRVVINPDVKIPSPDIGEDYSDYHAEALPT